MAAAAIKNLGGSLRSLFGARSKGDMLSDLVDTYVAEADSIDEEAPHPQLVEQIRLASQDTRHQEWIKRFFPVRIQPAERTRACLKLLKKMPPTMRKYQNDFNSRHRPPFQRFLLSMILASLVNPKDFIPNQAPDYYGMIDDCFLLRFSHLVFYGSAAPPFEEEKTDEFSLWLLLSCMPPEIVSKVQHGAAAIEPVVQFMRAAPRDLVERLILQLRHDPLGQNTSQFVNSMRISSGSMTWQPECSAYDLPYHNYHNTALKLGLDPSHPIDSVS